MKKVLILILSFTLISCGTQVSNDKDYSNTGVVVSSGNISINSGDVLKNDNSAISGDIDINSGIVEINTGNEIKTEKDETEKLMKVEDGIKADLKNDSEAEEKDTIIVNDTTKDNFDGKTEEEVVDEMDTYVKDIFNMIEEDVK